MPLIHHVITGSGRPPIVFVHGFCCAHSDWDAQVAHFSPRHQTITVDLRGHGASPGTSDECSVERYGADVAGVMRALALPPAVLIGLSMGCRVVVEAASQAPDHIAGVVLVDGSQFAPTVESMLREAFAVPDGYTALVANWFKDMFTANSDAAVVASMAERAARLPRQIDYKLSGDRFADFASRIGVDRASAYQLVKLKKHKAAILTRCRDEGRYYGWETCLYWFEKAPRRLWRKDQGGDSNNDEYATPPSVFERFGSACTLDVCATAGKAMCTEYFTKAHNGLKQRWRGTVWMNPPYSDLYSWCAKAYEHARASGTVIALLPAWTDAPWFHDFVSYGRITFIRGKLSYIGRRRYAPFPSIIVEWNPTTVKRHRGTALDAVLDTGIAMSGTYIAG